MREIQVDLGTLDVKIPAIKLFEDLGKLVDRQLKHSMMEKSGNSGQLGNNTDSTGSSEQTSTD